MKQKLLNSLNMFWKEFNPFKFILFFSFSLLTVACSTKQEEKTVEKEEGDKKKTELSEEERIIRQVENKLDISAAENYDIQIKYTYINPDTLKDALILVNRRDFAFKKAKSSDTERFFENTGYTGPYNFVYVKLGGEKKLISTTPVGSNAEIPLEVEFLELTSKAHQDFFVEYRIRNSKHRNYYTVRNKSIHLTFSCPVFDSIGAPKPVAYDVQHKTSSVRVAKDIALYHGEIVDYQSNSIEDINQYEPEKIVSKGDLLAYFIFDEKSMKYKTPMPAMEK